MRAKWLLVVAVVVAAGIGAGALSHRLRKPTPPAPKTAAAAIVNGNELVLTGTVQAQHVTNVGAEIDGNLEAFTAEVGDEVFEGQVLARIGSADVETAREQASAAVEAAQQAVSTAESALASARLEQSRADADLQRSKSQVDRAQKTFERQKLLHDHGATPKIKYDATVQEYEAAVKDFDIMDKSDRAARDAVRTANDQLAQAKQALAERGEALENTETAFAAAELRAPVTGTIVARKGELNKPAREFGNDLFQIATDLFALEVAAEARPEQLKRLYPGEDALVVLLDLGTAGLAGRVREIKDARAVVEFNSNVPAVKPGMRAEVRIKLN
jgi:multidrug resistance efflux pump